MANSYFDFKQFRIEQGNCGMKVSTDACILGAWAPIPQGPCHILDIGAGTGLLSLMMAQRAPEAMIDALEIDAAAAVQAGENIAASRFKHQINIHGTDANVWQASDAYDLIICNPPFFINSLKSPEAGRNLARHNFTLQQKDLIGLFNIHLRDGGLACVLWPAAESLLFTALAEKHHWWVKEQLLVKDHAAAKAKRVITVFSREEEIPVITELIIKQQSGAYTNDFTALMSPFYLHL